MKLPKLKAPKIKMPKPPKAIRHGLKEAGKVARHLPAEKVIVHAAGHGKATNIVIATVDDSELSDNEMKSQLDLNSRGLKWNEDARMDATFGKTFTRDDGARAARLGRNAIMISTEDFAYGPDPSSERVASYRLSAEGDNVEAARKLGLLYLHGRGVTKDLNEALTWLQRAAIHGDAASQVSIGLMYFSGNGVSQDYSQAFDWFTKAADQDDAKAQCLIGGMYRTGKGVPQDDNKALMWLQKAADQNNADAQYAIGVMYENGEGVDKDNGQELKWLQKAADQDHAGAQFLLGGMYISGDGVDQDVEKAFSYFKRAAEQGDSEAQYCVALMYENGKGVDKDIASAIEWYKRAAANGNSDALAALGRIDPSGQATLSSLDTNSDEKLFQDAKAQAMQTPGLQYLSDEAIREIIRKAKAQAAAQAQ